jgi:uncharacterized RDD family membrane protein YckC
MAAVRRPAAQEQERMMQQAMQDRTARPPGPADSAGRRAYLALLTWAFTLFSSVRVLSYLPMMAAIVRSGDSSQHSLWTWCLWLGANATMAAWLYETQGRRANRAVLVNACNAAMCLLTAALIVAYRA